MIKAITISFYTIILLLFTSGIAPAQEPEKMEENMNQAPKVYIDCKASGNGAWMVCDLDYLRREIQFVNFVREQREADVHVLITSRASAGGNEFTIAYIGGNGFKGIDDTLKYYSNQIDAEETIRAGFTHTLKAGLVRYIARSPLLERIGFSFKGKPSETIKIKDIWNHWIFSARASGYLRGEKNSKGFDIYGSLSASRITPDMKMDFYLDGSYDRSTYTYIENDEEITYESISKDYDLDALVVFSLNDHWSAGGFAQIESDTYDNVKSSFMIAPALEFNVFPYEESTRKQFRFLYRLGLMRNNYFEETIYDKTAETLVKQSLEIDLVIKQQWGTARTSIEGSHYFHDNLEHNRLAFYGSIDLKLLKGISLNVSANYSLIHDQLSLEKEGLTPEEVLLQRKQLETTYRYSLSAGIRYTFGSIFNNVVNPRFSNP